MILLVHDSKKVIAYLSIIHINILMFSLLLVDHLIVIGFIVFKVLLMD